MVKLVKLVKPATKVLFTGFFGIQPKHTQHYISMWKKLNATVDPEPYHLRDVFSVNHRHAIIRDTFQPKQAHYDVIHCISGGCLYLFNLLQAKHSFTYDRIIFDSGPYLYSTPQVENFVHQTYPNSKCIPVKRLIDIYYNNKLGPVNAEYERTVLYTPADKLVLTSTMDRTIDQPFVEDFIHKTGAKHVKFPTGAHANIYKTNMDEYTSALMDFVK